MRIDQPNIDGNLSVSGSIINTPLTNAVDGYLYINPTATTLSALVNAAGANIETIVISSPLTLGSSSVTINMTNYMSTGTYVLQIVQAYSTAQTVSWASPSIKWPNATAPTISTGGGAIDIISLVYNGTYMFGSYVQNMG